MKALLRIIFIPFSLLYGIIVFIRNFCYNIGLFKSYKVNKIVISVGNLNVGGTGKTPHVEYLIKLLQPNYNVATLSRGYKRKTTGFIKASNTTTSIEIGDEPFQYYTKFPNAIVAVDENRVNGINQLLKLYPKIDVFLLDDAYQHRAIHRDINILITDYNNLYSEDYLIPSGTLREWRYENKRADLIIVSKTPENITKNEQQEVIKKLHPKYYQKVYFTFIKYNKPLSFTDINPHFINNNTSVLAFCGIANPKPFFNHIRNTYQLIDTIIFSDHYQYTNADISKIITEFKKINSDNKVVFTTEKDIMRLYLPELKNQLQSIPIFYIPIKVDFIGNEKEDFDKEILAYVSKNKRN